MEAIYGKFFCEQPVLFFFLYTLYAVDVKTKSFCFMFCKFKYFVKKYIFLIENLKQYLSAIYKIGLFL